MATLEDLSRRVERLETRHDGVSADIHRLTGVVDVLAGAVARLADTVESHERTLYAHSRRHVRTDLRLARIMADLKIDDVTDADVDEVLDSE